MIIDKGKAGRTDTLSSTSQITQKRRPEEKSLARVPEK